MENIEVPFIPGISAEQILPLARYLPPLPPGSITTWLGQQAEPGSWVIDPLGSNPLPGLEAARAGYRVLVACNNPILRFMLETLARAASKEDYQAAIAALANTRRGEERLEKYIQSLYQTECAGCGRIIQAEAYLWRKEEDQPFAREYTCPHCGDQGEHPVTPYDLDRLNLIGSVALHRARALSRVVADGDHEQKELVEEALKTYPPRPLYVLFMLINKLEGISIPPEKKQLLTALFISLCDESNTLWSHPTLRPRPRQLTIPTQFREKNLWLALENLIHQWVYPASPVPLKIWPEQPPETGGICLFQGRIRALFPLPASIQPKAVIGVVPRPNQAFWTLCALWSGWLWGREAVQPLQWALERSRYDWHWLLQALNSALITLNRGLPNQTPLWIISPELTPSFLFALVAGPRTAGLKLSGFAINAEEEIGQFTWKSGEPTLVAPRRNPKQVCQEAIQMDLTRRGEPANYLNLYSAFLLNLLKFGELPLQVQEITPDWFSRLQNTLTEVLSNRDFLIRYSGKAQAEESGQWWLAHSAAAEAPLADRIEKSIVSFLLDQQEIARSKIDQSLYQQFRGLLTPSSPLITACLDSYAECLGGYPCRWRLRAQEQSFARKGDLSAAAKILQQMGKLFNLKISGENPLFWQDAKGEIVYAFYFLASSNISRFVFEPPPVVPNRCILVMPGGRANLLSVKLRRDPRLEAALAHGWRILKFRHLRFLTTRKDLTLALWDELLDGDPPRWEDAVQMSIF